VDFYAVRDTLVKSKQKFTADNLHLVPYDQLALCCIGNAGAAACSQKAVQQEQEQRRERFLHMQPEELAESENYLKMERMYDDVIYAIAYRNAPTWESLNDRQKACAKLVCIANHIDNPHPRLKECLALLRKCSTTSLPTDAAMAYMMALKALQGVYPGRMSDETFRNKIAEILDNLMVFLPDEELPPLDKEELQGFSCTSDCFRIML
jgi:hypothetical protein